MKKYRTFKEYKERVLFLCRDWEVLPSNCELREMWIWFNRISNNK